MTTETTTITIADEGTRRAVEGVLWAAAAVMIDGNGDLYSATWDAYNESTWTPWETDGHEEAANLIDAFHGYRHAAAVVRAAKLPTEIALPLTADSLGVKLGDLARDIEQDLGESFWTLPPDRREMVTATRDAARRLLAEITPAEVARCRPPRGAQSTLG